MQSRATQVAGVVLVDLAETLDLMKMRDAEIGTLGRTCPRDGEERSGVEYMEVSINQTRPDQM